jgi:LmbE family N-acetylglucosaminyl deacetylase
MGRIVFLLAHPDDEFACSIPIRNAVGGGDEVHCVYLTDGGYGGQRVRVRMEESLRALALLGVPHARVHFLGVERGFPDGALHRHLERAATVLQEWFDALGAIDEVHVPAWEGGHQDHDAVQLIGAVVARRTGVSRIVQFPLYHGAGLPGPLFRVLAPLPANGPVAGVRASAGERWLAVRLCLCFASQWRTWVGLLPFFVWRMLVDGRFPQQPVDPMRWRQSPHPGVVLHERRGFVTRAEFAACADAFLGAEASATVGTVLE